MDRVCEAQRRLVHATAGAVSEISGGVQTGYRPETNREPFGFHDGMGQPSIQGLTGKGVPTGEFILGYPNHYRIIAPTPVVDADLDGAAILPPLENPYHTHAALRDLGRNGSYVVYRKLQQDVAGFWQFMKREAARARGSEDPAHMVWLASRLVGRWPSGAPIAVTPDTDSPRLGDHDEFLYKDDPDGFACPLGAHVRRVNPRDVIKPYGNEQSLSMSEAHRLLRRGRVFGPPLFDPHVLDAPASPGGEVLTDLRDDGERAGHPFFLREREHQEPVRVRAADVVQQSAVQRPARQQGSDRRKQRLPGRPSELHDHSRRTGAAPDRGGAALRDGEGRGVSVHAQPGGAPVSRELQGAGLIIRSLTVVHAQCLVDHLTATIYSSRVVRAFRVGGGPVGPTWT